MVLVGFQIELCLKYLFLNQVAHKELAVEACHPSLMKAASLTSKSLLIPSPPSSLGRETVAQLT